MREDAHTIHPSRHPARGGGGGRLPEDGVDFAKALVLSISRIEDGRRGERETGGVIVGNMRETFNLSHSKQALATPPPSPLRRARFFHSGLLLLLPLLFLLPPSLLSSGSHVVFASASQRNLFAILKRPESPLARNRVFWNKNALFSLGSSRPTRSGFLFFSSSFAKIHFTAFFSHVFRFFVSTLWLVEYSSKRPS